MPARFHKQFGPQTLDEVELEARLESHGRSEPATVSIKSGDAGPLAITLNGGDLTDVLQGTADADTLDGGGGDDTLIGGGGNDALIGGTGFDVAVLSGGYADYQTNAARTSITDMRGGSPDGADTLDGVEMLRFSDRHELLTGLSEGGDLVLTAVMFAGSPAGFEADTQFVVPQTFFGALLIDGVVQGTNAIFSLAQLNAGQVVFRHDGSENHYPQFDVTAVPPTGPDITLTFAMHAAPVNDAPVAVGTQTQTITFGGFSTSSSTTVFSDVTVTDAEGNWDGGTLAFSTQTEFFELRFVIDEGVGFESGQITFGGVVVGTYATGQTFANVSLNGAATTAAVQAIARSFVVATSHTSHIDTFADLTITDGAGAATSLPRRVLSYSAPNQDPILGNAGGTLTFGENLVNATPQVLDDNIIFQDDENSGRSVIVTGLLAEDVVALRDFTLIHNLTGDLIRYTVSGGALFREGLAIGTVTGGQGSTLTITLGSDNAVFTAILQNLTYANTSDAPTAGRTLEIAVVDSVGAADIETYPINVTAENDMPFLTELRPFAAFDEDVVLAEPQLLDADVSFSDPEEDFNPGILELSGLLAEDRISVRNEGTGPGQIGLSGSDVTFGGVVIGFAAGGVGTTFTVSFNGNATSAAIDALIQNLTYANVSQVPTSSRPLSLRVTDAAGQSTGAVPITVLVVPQDDAPVAVDDAAGTINESAILFGNVFAANGGAADSDPDSALSISHINGVAAVFGSQITLASGAILTIEPDGEFTYTAAGAFGDLSGPASGGSNQQRFDTFTYTLTGGGTATVTVRVTGLDSDGDLLTGGAGDDTLDGGAGRDRLSYIGAGAGVTVDLNIAGSQNTGGAGSPTIVNIEDLTGSAFDDVLTGLTGFGSSLIGLGGDDRLIGGAGDNVLDGGAGNDTADYSGAASLVSVDLTLVGAQNTGGAGMDTLIGIENVNGTFSGDFLTGDGVANMLFGNDGEDVLSGGGGNDILNGGEAFDVLFGGTGDDVLFGNDGDDRLFDDAGDDTLDGGEGVDRAFYWMATAAVTVDLAIAGAQNTGGAGIDTLASIEQLVGSDFNDVLSGRDDEDNLLDGRDGNDVLNGRGGDDELFGEDGDDTLNGGAGDDQLRGVLGNDTLNGGAGIDTVAYEDAGGAVFLRLGGGTSSDGDGGTDTLIDIENVEASSNDDVVIGSSAANLLRGGAGRDVLVGLGGNDVLNGGNGDANTLIGGLGDDIYVSDAADTIVELADQGTDTVQTDQAGHTLRANVENLTYTGDQAFSGIGNDLANVITGGDEGDTLSGMGGNDTLRGGTGTPNTLIGGTGDDTYFVNTFDSVIELANEGTDRVITELASYTLAANIENLSFAGEAGFLGLGNTLGNDITGGTQRDTLLGLGGNDILRGGTGAANTLIGGTGDDTYVVAAIGDTVLESAGEGTDTVQTALTSHTLRAEVENLTYTGAATFTGVGNAGSNVITGGTAADVLRGEGGNDTLIGGTGAANTLLGGLGDDTYVVRANDSIVELSGEGADTVQTDRAFFTLGANLENLTYTGSGVFQGTGNDLANVITGGAQNDTLIGGLGNDTLNGGAGTADIVVLSGVLANYTITDLGGGSYRIVDAIGGRDGTDTTTGVERVRFASGPTVALSSLAVPAPAPLEPSDKDTGGFEVLPGLGDDDFLPLAKDGDLPLVLPGSGDLFADLFGGLERLSLERGSDSPWQMLTLDPEATPGDPADGFIGARDHSGWNHDTWLF